MKTTEQNRDFQQDMGRPSPPPPSQNTEQVNDAKSPRSEQKPGQSATIHHRSSHVGPEHVSNRRHSRHNILKPGALPRPVGGSDKLGTFSGVFVPTTLNVLSILMFIRFGFILGQAGVLGTVAMMAVAYFINLVTTMSISAIASNGTVRGGGAYYLISRSLGPEFGGSIGVVFYMGFVFNTGLNAVGLIDCLIFNFGSQSGNWARFLQEGFWWQYIWATMVLLLCTAVCLAGSGIFARCSNGLVVILLLATFSIPLSALANRPYTDPAEHINFTGLSVSTLRENLMPNFTKHAAGSQLKGRENFQSLFGVLFPATGGIFAGASMSGDLRKPSKSIPKGTLYGLALTFLSYAMVIFALAASIRRVSFYENLNVIQETNLSGILILLGEFATTFFSALMGVIGPAKLLQAIARDSLLPGLSIFGQGTPKGDEPTYAIIFTFIVAQLTMLADVNRIASCITMTYLMTFLVTNLACFLLTISSAPNFRPSFRYFNWWTAAAGTLVCAVAMFVVDGAAAAGAVGILIVIFLIIHYTTPPKAWGDVSQSLIYHQVRKYLLRLKQDHVKFWRPQILLLVNDPRRGYKLIQFCNSLKKGALFVLGHVIVTSNFGASVPEARRQQAAWSKYIDLSKIKAFINIAISPSIEWGARNVVLSAGLGGMRPNIVIMGRYNLKQFREERPLVDVPSPPPEWTSRKQGKASGGLRKRRSVATKQLEGVLPTDECYIEKVTDVQSYLMVLEDMLLKLQINVAVAAGFGDLELPTKHGRPIKKYIDLWPIQMSSTQSSDDEQKSGKDITSTNFDTYTLILQLGCILNTVPAWKKCYGLRVAVFVEYESDVEEERARVGTLLEKLRIRAEVLVFWLAAGDVKSYQMVVNGNNTAVDTETEDQVEKILEDEQWWADLKRHRETLAASGESKESFGTANNLNSTALARPAMPFHDKRQKQNSIPVDGLKGLLSDSRSRPSAVVAGRFGTSTGMRTQSLDQVLMKRRIDFSNESESESDGLDPEETRSFDTISALEDPERGEDGYRDSIDEEEEEEEEENLSRYASAPSEPLENKMPLLAASPRYPSNYGDSQTPRLWQGRRNAKISEETISQSHRDISKSTGDEQDRTLVDVSPSTAPSLSVKANTEYFSPGDDQPSPSDRKNQERERKREEGQLGLSLQGSQQRPPSNFSSSPVPICKVANHEGPGPSIMFAEENQPDRPFSQQMGGLAAPPVDSSVDEPEVSPSSHPRDSLDWSAQSQADPLSAAAAPATTASHATVPARASSQSSNPQSRSQPEQPAFQSQSCQPQSRTSSLPSMRAEPHDSLAATTAAASTVSASLPLSFNDLPCRAQHLILNELISQQSEDTAVVFTTLPPPQEGTYRSETDSLAYVSDLEVLCGGLPPTLLVHSNTLTVTMNL